MASAGSEVHLVVLVHGLWGNPGHLAELKQHILLRISRDAEWDGSESNIELLVCSSISDDLTYDGIDWGGERVAQEVLSEIRNIEADGRVVKRLSAIGYSLGGLVCRYLIGILYQKGMLCDDSGLPGVTTGMKPINFITIATPHLGIPRYPGALNSLFSVIGGKLLSRTGRQLYLCDNWGNGKPPASKPILEVMANPDQIFYKALCMFKTVAVYANAVNDLSVPYLTGAVESDDPFYADEASHIEVELDEEYSPVLKSWKSLSPFEARKMHRRSVLPPYMRADFPYNMVLYPLIPFIAPVFLGAALLRLGNSSRKSQARIRALENDASFTDTLYKTIAQLQKGVETVGTKLDDTSTRIIGEQPYLASTETLPSDASPVAKPDTAKETPRLSEKQTMMSRSLNALPNLRKVFAWIHPMRNSHAHIICRDIKIFADQKVGEGVLRHVADHLLL